ncbi:hypothetical protein [Bradyrhizobium sp. LA2.1]|uniref:hypothetical protein n=1 Tax=Bradyrhizobium sp. LA2.1 TaxID=3156376 RepID=UPI0033931C93
MSEPTPIHCWSVWHPKHEWGLNIPMLYQSRDVAVYKLKAGGVWPLKDGWKLIPVTVSSRLPSEH